MHVLLTGGYGCLGAWIVRQLLARGARATVYDLKQDPRRLRLIMPEQDVARVGFRQGDVTDLDRLKQVTAEDRAPHHVHHAG
jgi:nucleoside-diphosphate-sugar epimerase